MTLSFAPERIEQWPLVKLQPYAKNAKAHGADQVAKICSVSIARSFALRRMFEAIRSNSERR